MELSEWGFEFIKIRNEELEMRNEKLGMRNFAESKQNQQTNVC